MHLFLFNGFSFLFYSSAFLISYLSLKCEFFFHYYFPVIISIYIVNFSSRWFIFHVQNCGQNPERFCGKKKSNGCTHQLTHRSKYTIRSRRYLNKFFEFANVLIYLVATDSYNDISSRIWKKNQNKIESMCSSMGEYLKTEINKYNINWILIV